MLSPLCLYNIYNIDQTGKLFNVATGCFSQNFNDDLSDRTIHCGMNQNCNIECGEEYSCKNATFYIYEYPTTISCSDRYSCQYATIISTNTSSLNLTVDAYYGFQSGYLSVWNSGNVSIQCQNHFGLLFVIFVFLVQICLCVCYKYL